MAQDKTKDAAYINDFQTPPNVASYIASLIPDHIKTVTEPTPGAGNIVIALERRGFHVFSPKCYWDIKDTDRFEAIACNLPFSSKTWTNLPDRYADKGMVVSYEQLFRLMQMTESMVALMPWFTISDSDVRLRAIKKYGLISVTALPRKTFQYARIQTCILQFQKGYTGSTEFKVFDLLTSHL